MPETKDKNKSYSSGRMSLPQTPRPWLLEVLDGFPLLRFLQLFLRSMDDSAPIFGFSVAIKAMREEKQHQ
jgi:hypothetical protein